MQAIGGGRGERFRANLTPYIVEPMENCDSGLYLTQAIVGPGQSAKTVIAENWFLKSVGADPAKFLWYMQSDDAVEAYVKDRINPMIDDHDVLSGNQGLRSIDDSLHYKRFRGMSVEFLTASMGNLINKNAPRIVADEIDAYKKLFGDVKALLDIRRQRFGNQSFLLCLSHPDRAKGLKPETDWDAGIMAIYADSTRCVWYWRCPSCAEFSSPCPIAARVMSIEYPDGEDATLDEVEAGAFLLCPNGCVVPDSARMEMNRTGLWVGEGETISRDGRILGKRIERKTAGYWIVGAMSPFILGGIGGLARARVKAEREAEISGEDETLRQVIVKQWGIPYAPKRAKGSVDANTLADRAEKDFVMGFVPRGGRFLSCAVDCQSSTFEFLTRAWGAGGESWIIDRGKILADPATSPEDWDNLLLNVFGKLYPLADGSSRVMSIRACGFDTAGTAGTTQQAYTAWRRWRKSNKVRLYGKISNREAWSIIGMKGASGINAARLQISYPDTSRAANKLAGRGDVPIALFNPNNFKDDLSGQLQRADVGAFYIHFPYELRGIPTGKPRGYPIDPPHVWFEQAVSEHVLKNGRWGKINPNAKNEALDLLVMTHILAFLHGLPRIDWTRPPPWAADWDANVLVSRSPSTPPDGGSPIVPARKGGEVKVTIDPATKKTIGSRLA